MTEPTTEASHAAQLREGMIAELRDLEALRTDPVEKAFRAVPRHSFTNGATLEQAYAAERAEVFKRQHGVALSSISAARIQAFMLEQACIEPGMRVLEIGSGGYNAALISEMVGQSGHVTTIDIDHDVIERTRRLLDAAGYAHVRALCTDGANGAPEHAPYDRIIITVEAAELAQAWLDQLAPDGRVVVPLRMRGLTRSVAFRREGTHLIADNYEVCGFVPMQGAGARPEQLVALHDDGDDQVGLRLESGKQIRAAALQKALHEPRAEAWSGMTMPPGQPYDDLDLWLATQLDDFALLAGTKQAREHGVVASWSPMGVAGMLSQDARSLAYLAIRPANAERTEFEFGAIGHGRQGQEAADRLVAEIQQWDRRHRGIRAQLRAHPAEAADHERPTQAGRLLAGEAFHITISWPVTTQ